MTSIVKREGPFVCRGHDGEMSDEKHEGTGKERVADDGKSPQLRFLNFSLHGTVGVYRCRVYGMQHDCKHRQHTNPSEIYQNHQWHNAFVYAFG